jgi:O-antigen/teichoic acid export membrane protein
LAGALGVGGTAIGALYAALRIGAAFTWFMAAIVTVVVPLIAEALARPDFPRVSYLVRRSAFLGGMTMTPLAVAGAVFAGPLLGVVHSSYDRYGLLLVIVLLGRLIDVGTGALGEALILGEHARWELINQLQGTVLLIAAGVAFDPMIGVAAVAAGAALQQAGINVSRLVELRWLFRHDWDTRLPANRMAS